MVAGSERGWGWDAYIEVSEDFVKVLPCEFGAFAFKFGLEGGYPFVVVVVWANGCHVVDILVSESAKCFTKGYGDKCLLGGCRS